MLTSRFARKLYCGVLCVPSQPIVYGQVIQLRHVQSRAFLQVNHKMLSDSERNASVLRLFAEGRCGGADVSHRVCFALADVHALIKSTAFRCWR